MSKFLHRPLVPTTLFGVALVVMGALVAAVLTVANEDISLAFTVQRSAIATVVIGVVLLVYAGLRRKGRSIEEAYRLGYDVGFENGYRAGGEAAVDEAAHRDAARHRHHAATVVESADSD